MIITLLATHIQKIYIISESGNNLLKSGHIYILLLLQTFLINFSNKFN